MTNRPRLERQIPPSGQAYRAARDEALADFAEEIVQAGLIRETFQGGVLTLEVAAAAKDGCSKCGGTGSYVATAPHRLQGYEITCEECDGLGTRDSDTHR